MIMKAWDDGMHCYIQAINPLVLVRVFALAVVIVAVLSENARLDTSKEFDEGIGSVGVSVAPAIDLARKFFLARSYCHFFRLQGFDPSQLLA